MAKHPQLSATNAVKAVNFFKSCVKFSGDFLYVMQFLAENFLNRIWLGANKKDLTATSRMREKNRR